MAKEKHRDGFRQIAKRDGCGYSEIPGREAKADGDQTGFAADDGSRKQVNTNAKSAADDGGAFHFCFRLCFRLCFGCKNNDIRGHFIDIFCILLPFASDGFQNNHALKVLIFR